jgi:hypothetical protein
MTRLLLWITGGLAPPPSTGSLVNALATSSKIAACASSRTLPQALRSAPDPRLVYLGDDADGVALEVVAIELEEGSLLVIHAMPLRDRYREQYEEAKRWRR